MATIFFVLTIWAILFVNRSETLPTPTNTSGWPSGLIDYVKSTFTMTVATLHYQPPCPEGYRLGLKNTVRPVSFAVLNKTGWFETDYPVYVVKIFSRIRKIYYSDRLLDVLWFSIIQNRAENTISRDSASYYVLYSSPMESLQAVLTNRMHDKIEAGRYLQYCSKSDLKNTPQNYETFAIMEERKKQENPLIPPNIKTTIRPDSNEQLMNAFKIASDSLTTVKDTIYTGLEPFPLENSWYSEGKKEDGFEDFYAFYFELKEKQAPEGTFNILDEKPSGYAPAANLDLAEFRVGIFLNSKQEPENFEFIPLTENRDTRMLEPAHCTLVLNNVKCENPQLKDYEEVTKFTVNTGCTLYSIFVDTIILKKTTGTTRKPTYVYSYYAQVRLGDNTVKSLFDPAAKGYEKVMVAIRTAYTKSWDLSGWLTREELNTFLGNDKNSSTFALKYDVKYGEEKLTVTEENFTLGRLKGWNLNQTEFEFSFLYKAHQELNSQHDAAFFLLKVTVRKLMDAVANNGDITYKYGTLNPSFTQLERLVDVLASNY